MLTYQFSTKVVGSARSNGLSAPSQLRTGFMHLTVQLALLGFASYLVPLVAPLVLFGVPASGLASTQNTQFASVLAAMAALISFRQVTAFPGARRLGFIVPAFSVTFGLAAVLLLLLRVPYSGPMLVTGYLASAGIGFLLCYLQQRGEILRLYYVPSEKIGDFSGHSNVEWIRLAKAEVPRGLAGSIVADLRAPHAPEWERMLAEAAISGIPIYHVKQLRESLTGRVEIDHLSENSFGSLLPALAYRGIKRGIDLLGSLLLLPILVLPMMCVAVLVKISSPGPVLFRQRRMGYKGQAFYMLKFRTMRVASGDGTLCERQASVTQQDDSRVTRIGRFLRRSRIDELPQIVNILFGEMSWIGPRPEAVPLSRWYETEIPFYRYRHIVRPGLTGWAQVNQGHVAELDDVHVKLHYDFYYVKFFSFWLDVLIALRTVRIVFTGFGAK